MSSFELFLFSNTLVPSKRNDTKASLVQPDTFKMKSRFLHALYLQWMETGGSGKHGASALPLVEEESRPEYACAAVQPR